MPFLITLLAVFLNVLAFPKDNPNRPVPHPSIVDINNKCTGFIFGKNTIMSAGHCVTVLNNYRVKFSDGTAVDAKLMKLSTQYDYMILSAETGDRALIKITLKAPPSGDTWLYCKIGYDEGNRVVQKKGCGKFVGIDEVGLYEFSLPICSGNSGGPILDTAGNVVGVISTKIIAPEIPGACSSTVWATPISNIFADATGGN